VMVAKRDSKLLPDAKSLQGKRVGVLQGSSQEDFLKAHWETAGVSIVSYQDQDQVYADLVAGRLDACVQEAQTVQDGFLGKPEARDYAILGAPLSDPATLGEGTGLGLRKGDFNQQLPVRSRLGDPSGGAIRSTPGPEKTNELCED
jgi:lysine/arginine/ornithine transport system substrate-binding protein